MMTSLCCPPASSQNLSEWVRCNLAHAVLDRLSKNCFIIINLLTSAQSTKHFAKIIKKKLQVFRLLRQTAPRAVFLLFVCLLVGFLLLLVCFVCLLLFFYIPMSCSLCLPSLYKITDHIDPSFWSALQIISLTKCIRTLLICGIFNIIKTFQSYQKTWKYSCTKPSCKKKLPRFMWIVNHHAVPNPLCSPNWKCCYIWAAVNAR